MTKQFLQIKFTILTIISALALSFSISSCTDVDKSLGLNFIPEEQQVAIQIDTIYPELYNITLDSIICNNVSVYPFGSYYDPIFGTTNAGMAFQMAQYRDSCSFGTAPVIDSIFMTIIVPKIQGDNAYAQNINLYELTQAIGYDSIYYPTKNIRGTMINPTPVATYTYTRNLANRWDKSFDTINLKVDNSVGYQLAALDTANFFSDTAFIKAFKGFYIATDETPAGTTGRMNYMDVSSNSIFMTIYYKHNGNDTTKLFYNTVSSYTYTTAFSDIEHKYNTATDPLRVNTTSLNDTASVATDSTIYIQGLYGVTPYLKLKSNAVQQWITTKNIDVSTLAISNAKLEFDVERYLDFNIDEYPDTIGLFYKSRYAVVNSNGDSVKYPHASAINEMTSTIFGGIMNGTHYKYPCKITYDFTNQVKKLNTQPLDLKMYVSPYVVTTDSYYGYSTTSIDQTSMYKALLKGSTSSKPPRIIITYTRAKQ